MYALKFCAIDIHSALVRLLDRIRVTGAQLVAIDAERYQDQFAVVIRFSADDGNLVDRLANQVSRYVGVSAVSVGCGRVSAGDLQNAGVAVFVPSDTLSA